jgi:branched-chain amino acid transport system permease protein
VEGFNTSLRAFVQPARKARGVLRFSLIVLACALVPPIAELTGQRYLVDLSTRIMIFAIAAMALDLLIGYAGLISFGHGAFIGVGAYTVGILSAEGVSEMAISLPAALLASMLFAWITGIFCVKTKGASFIMITLAFGQMAYFVAISLAAYGGDNGLPMSGRSTLAGFPILKSDGAMYYAVLLFLAGTYSACAVMAGSRFGRVLRGAKENATRIAAIGFDVKRFQLAAYVIAGGIGGLSGFLLANSTEFVAPAYMSWQRSGELIVMVILGGAGTLHGAIIGASAYLLAEELLSGITENWKVILGPLLVLVVLSGSGGLTALAARLRRRLARD